VVKTYEPHAGDNHAITQGELNEIRAGLSRPQQLSAVWQTVDGVTVASGAGLTAGVSVTTLDLQSVAGVIVPPQTAAIAYYVGVDVSGGSGKAFARFYHKPGGGYVGQVGGSTAMGVPATGQVILDVNSGRLTYEMIYVAGTYTYEIKLVGYIRAGSVI
jgi:hypothetical protein